MRDAHYLSSPHMWGWNGIVRKRSTELVAPVGPHMRRSCASSRRRRAATPWRSSPAPRPPPRSSWRRRAGREVLVSDLTSIARVNPIFTSARVRSSSTASATRGTWTRPARGDAARRACEERFHARWWSSTARPERQPRSNRRRVRRYGVTLVEDAAECSARPATAARPAPSAIRHLFLQRNKIITTSGAACGDEGRSAGAHPANSPPRRATGRTSNTRGGYNYRLSNLSRCRPGPADVLALPWRRGGATSPSTRRAWPSSRIDFQRSAVGHPHALAEAITSSRRVRV